MPPSASQPCKVCGCSEVKLTDGFYFCIECGTQNTDMQETLLDMAERDVQNDRLAFAKKTKIRKQKIEVQMSEEWKIWHAFNFIIANMGDELIALGASPSFKLKLLWVWTKYIKKFHKKEDDVQINRTKNKTFDIDKDNLIDSDADSDIVQDQPTVMLPDCSAAYKRLRQGLIEKFSLSVIYALLYVALNLDQSDIQLSDMMRWQREGRLSCKECVKHVPEDLDVYSIKAWSHLVQTLSYSKIRSTIKIHNSAAALFEVLDLGSPCVPDLTALLNRFCKELCLPKEFRALALSVLDQFVFPANRNFLSGLLPDYDLAVMSCIVVAMKMCFGLDDHYDLKLSFYIDEINDEHKHLNAYRIGASEPTDRKFNIRDWLSFLEYRKHILAKYYYPIAYLYQHGLKEPLGSEGIKDHVTLQHNAHTPWKRRKALDRITHDVMKTMPLKGDYPIIPKEDFPASLTPITAYTVFLVQRIKDPQERLVLTEDFSKYNLKYACEDLCLKSSEADDNLITGVSEEYKNVTKKAEILDVPIYPDYPEIYVVDYEYDNWVKDYRDPENEIEQTEEEFKQELKNELIEGGEIAEDEKPDPNMVEEMVENGNIFACFDTPYDMASVSSTINNTVNSIGEEYGHTFPEEPMQNEAFDPFYFNREEMIKKLVLDACFKYKVPIPHEYRETRYVPNRKKKTEEARVRQVHNHPISVADILNTYKSFVQEEDPLPTPVTLTEEVANSIENNEQGERIVQNNDEENITNNDIDLGNDNEEIDLNNTDLRNDIDNEPMEIETLDTIPATEDVDNIDNTDIEMDQVEEVHEEVEKVKKKYKRKAWDFTSEDVKKIEAKKQKNMNDRSYFEPLIKKNIDDLKFKYYLKYYHHKGLHNEKKIEELLLDDLPNSYRVVLQHCAAIIEHPIHYLIEGVQDCETQIFNEYSKREMPERKTRESKKQQVDSSSSEDTDDSDNNSETNDSEPEVINGTKIELNTDSDTTVESDDEAPVYNDTESGDESFGSLDEEREYMQPVDALDETERVDNFNAVDAEISGNVIEENDSSENVSIRNESETS